MLGNLRARLEAAVAKGELPAATDIDGLSRFYLSVFQGMADPGEGRRHAGGVERRREAAMAAWPGEG